MCLSVVITELLHFITPIHVTTHSDTHPIYQGALVHLSSFAHRVGDQMSWSTSEYLYETFSLSNLKHLPVLSRWSSTTDCCLVASVGACHSHR